ncbi:uncharacterized protein LOC141647343 [Silene latifolia]|uniref:uncharacterized protein LOC141647343 n=1 Tax=Silene latifolia TaxID=37657 RepID=UPI003D76ABF9
MKLMEYRPIEVKLIRGKDLKKVNVISTMDVYVIGSVSADPRSMQRTAVNKDGGVNPKWNHVMRFNVDESAARLNRLGLVFQIMSDRTLGDKEVGRVYVPLKELYEAVGVIDDQAFEVSKEEKYVVYQVQTSKGRFKGQLEFSFKFGEKFTQTIDRKLDDASSSVEYRANETAMPFDPKISELYTLSNQKLDNEPVMAYPAGPNPTPRPYPGPMPETSTYPSAGPNPTPRPYPGQMPETSTYPSAGPNPTPRPYPGPMPETSTYPSVGGNAPYNYGAPPQGYPQQGYRQGHGYGYNYPSYQLPLPPNAQMGYGCGYEGGYGYQGQASAGYAQPQKEKKSKFGLGAAAGVGAGLLGGLVVGEMMEDVADAAVYDDDDW